MIISYTLALPIIDAILRALLERAAHIFSEAELLPPHIYIIAREPGIRAVFLVETDLPLRPLQLRVRQPYQISAARARH